MIDVLRAGPLASVQDLGRFGHRAEGVGLAGALDPVGLRLANRLVGNPAAAAGLEIGPGGARLRFRRAARIALAGVGTVAELDGRVLWPGWREEAEAGSELVVRPPRIGLFSWLAIGGGVDVEPVLGSRSTDLRAGIGGMDGRALLAGDTLPLGEADESPARRVGIRLPIADGRIRFLPGPEWTRLDKVAQATVLAANWRISANSNRMGYRLEGPALFADGLPELLSHAVMPGLIQLPSGGQPIILMADAQTTGGYPRIGVVIAADLWKLAYLRPNESLHLLRVDEAAARSAGERLAHYIERVERSLDDQH
ncbi:MAG: biotin-dependent carboxyltransferase family protein [Zoogloea sp.]|nr:biotin-dependent carboxyltransferase family protein [Zoogloea sp.]